MRLEESQPVLAVHRYPTDPPAFQLGEDGAYTEGSRTLDDLPVVHDIGTAHIEGVPDDERDGVRGEEEDVRGGFDR